MILTTGLALLFLAALATAYIFHHDKKVLARRVLDSERETRLESALEKIRARSLAMHKSDELRDVVTELVAQLEAMGISGDLVNILIWQKDSWDYVMWLANRHFTYEKPMFFQYFEHPVNRGHREVRESGGGVYTWVYSKEVKNEFFLQAWTQQGTYVTEERKAMILAADRWTITSAFRDYSGLSIFWYSEHRSSEEEMRILGRFSDVFEQAYHRFMDLQKAEKQARDAQVQVALEKVRSRSLGMHKSEELRDVVTELVVQLHEVGIWADTANIVIWNSENDDYKMWIGTNHFTYNKPLDFKYFKHEVNDKLVDARKQGEGVYTWIHPKEVKDDYFLHSWSVIDNNEMSDERQKFILAAEKWIVSMAICKYSALSLFRYSGEPPTDEEMQVLKRFGSVFEQAYQRFLDLEKSEQQAREAQIEAALEKVRSRSLAMHKSPEIRDVVAELFERLRELNVDMDVANIMIWRGEKDYDIWVANKEFTYPESFYFAHFDHPVNNDIIEARDSGKEWLTHFYPKEVKDAFFAYLFGNTVFRAMPEERKQTILSADGWVSSWAIGKYTSLSLFNYSTRKHSEDDIGILRRFGKVFEQCYTRFLDLQTAEAQAREAQIQLSLERIRSRAMAMQHSDELSDLLTVLFEQFHVLGVNPSYCHMSLFDLPNNQFSFRCTGTKGSKVIESQVVDIDFSPVRRKSVDDWLAGHPQDFVELHFPYEQIPAVFEVFAEVRKNMPPDELAYQEDFPNGLYVCEGFCTYGYLGYGHSRPATPEDREITIRIGKEFGNVYQRFLDLQKAEAQAKEAEIQLALERVRAKTTAMQKQDDIVEVLDLIVDQLVKFGVRLSGANFSDGLPDGDWDLWLTNPKRSYTTNYIHYPRIEHPFFIEAERNLATFRSTGQRLFKNSFSKEEKDSFLRYCFSSTMLKDMFPPEGQQYLMDKPGYVWTAVMLKETWLSIGKYDNDPFSEEEDQLLLRFADAFDMTYTRFIDLQRAEQQAREAEIQLALERVRAKTMAMQKKGDLIELLELITAQVNKLGIHLDGINFSDGLPVKDWYLWMSVPLDESSYMINYVHFPWVDHPFFVKTEENLDNFHKKGIRFVKNIFGKSDKDSFLDYSFSHTALRELIPPEAAEFLYEKSGFGWSAVIMKETWVSFIRYTDQGFTAGEDEVLVRFADAFGMAYTRFLDIQKAEQQAREATIEAALERVRSKTMAMHNSNDVGETVEAMFAEFAGLGLQTNRCGILVYSDDDVAEVWTARRGDEGSSLIIGKLDLDLHPILRGLHNAWKAKQRLKRTELSGQDILDYYAAINGSDLYPVKFDLARIPVTEYNTSAFFAEGAVFAFSSALLPEEHEKILGRFAAVFGQTYRRYLDLQIAEASAKVALRQASLDRVRAEISSMRSVEDLQRITPLIWNELTTLHIPFIRCGIFIMDDDQHRIHTFLSTPDGKAIASFHQDYDGDMAAAVDHWRRNEVYVDHWDIEDFTSMADSLVQQGAVANREQYMQTLPPGGIYLHFLPFVQGMLYIGNTEELNEEDLDLVRTVADAFSTAYARYEDFVRIETAKRQVEKTLVDLRQAQQQLIQSEKMASLGELTAGIAHEIQNPLNFVNNFAEINAELAEELKLAAGSGDLDEVAAIAASIRQNDEKILEHGKRADAIVKGMLQHSRSGAGQKELADINRLAEEYLRLAYHGMRAKDKSADVQVRTVFDKSIGKRPMMVQDIGRVLLNLINNALYTVQEKARIAANGYKPGIEIQTRMSEDKVIILVKDNGNGIPETIREKIFQPFFTTKPTGQGTGLGLSLSYDIIKAHGGEIRVDSREGEGTVFSVVI